MKKVILLFAAIGFIATAATTKTSFSNEKISKKYTLNDEKYKACIEACNACIVACKNCETTCIKEKDPKMARCIQLCKESISACTASTQLMNLNSENAKDMCTTCAKICEKCAIECDKFNMDHCKKCAIDCRKAAKLCNEM